MKKIEVLNELKSNIEFFHISKNWESNFAIYLDLLQNSDDNINNEFIHKLKLTNDFVMELSNVMPMFLEGGNFTLFLKHSSPALLEFDFNELPFLSNFFELIKNEFEKLIDNTTYSIELNEISDILDSIIFYIESEMND